MHHGVPENRTRCVSELTVRKRDRQTDRGGKTEREREREIQKYTNFKPIYYAPTNARPHGVVGEKGTPVSPTAAHFARPLGKDHASIGVPPYGACIMPITGAGSPALRSMSASRLRVR